GNVNFSGTDWTATVASDNITWSTETFVQNPNANALRWDTLYNFRFDANAAPVDGGGSATITLFKPGTPSVMSTGSIALPGNPPNCPCEFNHDGVLTSSDFFDYLNAFFALDLSADFDGNGSVTSDDFFGFVNCFLTPPAGC